MFNFSFNMICFGKCFVSFLILSAIIFIPIIAFTMKSGETNNCKIVMDTDGGADDSMAIFIALLYEKYFNGPQIIAITTVNGNVNEPQVYKNIQRVLDIANRREVPIYRGSKHALVKGYPTDFYYGEDGLGDTSYHSMYEAIPEQGLHAVPALIELSKKYEDKLTVVTLGPVTNIALAVRFDPHFISRLEQLYVGAGHIQDSKHPEPEFNALLDVDAYHVVMENSVPSKVTTVPFSRINNTVDITTDWRVNTLGVIDTEIMRSQNAFEQIILNGTTVWSQLDPAIISVCLNKNIVEEYVYTNTSIILCGEKRGISINEIGEENKSNVRAVYSVSTEKYKQFLYDVFAAK